MSAVAKNVLREELSTCRPEGSPFDTGAGHCRQGTDVEVECRVQCKHLFGIFNYDTTIVSVGLTYEDIAREFHKADTQKSTCFGGMGSCKRCKAQILDRTDILASDWGACEKQIGGPQTKCEGPQSTPGEDITMDEFFRTRGEMEMGDIWDPNRQSGPNPDTDISMPVELNHPYCVDCCDNQRSRKYMNITTIRTCTLRDSEADATPLCRDPLDSSADVSQQVNSIIARVIYRRMCNSKANAFSSVQKGHAFEGGHVWRKSFSSNSQLHP